ncbi:MAG TPA: hypothetical protein VGK27_02160 [Candidatus Deferrimicrobiaceae bacterium]|jgi:hypothetical protein
MELHLYDHEVELLRDILTDDLARLIHEIGRTDSRTARKELKRGEAVLEGILDRLGGQIRKAS